MYRSAHYVLYVNYEDFIAEIYTTAQQHKNEPVYFFSGYDCDSLAMEPMTHFAKEFIPAINTMSNAWLELRTKSTQIRHLLDMPVAPRVVVAFSLSPQDVIDNLEHKTPSLAKRIEASVKLQRQGWHIGLRFDPILYYQDYESAYEQMFEYVFHHLDAKQLHSVSLGTFRMPEVFFKNMTRLYPDEALFAGPLYSRNGMISYEEELEKQVMTNSEKKLLQYIPHAKYYKCQYD